MILAGHGCVGRFEFGVIHARETHDFPGVVAADLRQMV
jgi:hypothetical protein